MLPAVQIGLPVVLDCFLHQKIIKSFARDDELLVSCTQTYADVLGGN